MNDLTTRLLTGSAAGFAASGPMAIFMEALIPAVSDEERDPPPPRQITQRAAETVGVEDEMSDDSVEAATMVNHFGYGTTAGMVYGAVAESIPLPPVARGIGFGLALWAGGYLGWLPASGMYRSATREPAGRNAVIVAAHILWGGLLGWIEHDLARASQSRTPRQAAPHHTMRSASTAASAK